MTCHPRHSTLALGETSLTFFISQGFLSNRIVKLSCRAPPLLRRKLLIFFIIDQANQSIRRLKYFSAHPISREFRLSACCTFFDVLVDVLAALEPGDQTVSLAKLFFKMKKRGKFPAPARVFGGVSVSRDFVAAAAAKERSIGSSIFSSSRSPPSFFSYSFLSLSCSFSSVCYSPVVCICPRVCLYIYTHTHTHARTHTHTQIYSFVWAKQSVEGETDSRRK